MNFSRYSKKILALMVFLSFFAIGILGLNMVQTNDEHHHMVTSCPYMSGDSSMCPMNLFDHLNSWKQNFTADFSLNIKIISVILFLLLVPFIIFEIFIRYFPGIRSLQISNENLHYKLFDWILLALKKGILEPKIYAPARVLA